MIYAWIATLVLITLPHGGHVYSGQPMPITLTAFIQNQSKDKDPHPDKDWQIRWTLSHGKLQLAKGHFQLDENHSTWTLQAPAVRQITALQWHYEIMTPIENNENLSQKVTLGTNNQVQSHLLASTQTVTANLWIHPPAKLDWAEHFARKTELTVIGELGGEPGASTLADWLISLGFKVRVAGQTDQMAIHKAQWLIVQEAKLSPRTMQSVRSACENGARLLVLGQPTLLDAIHGTTPKRQWHGGMDIPRPTTPVTIQNNHPLLAGFEPQWIQTWVNENQIIVARRTDVPSGGTSVVGWPNPDTLTLEQDARAASKSLNKVNVQKDALANESSPSPDALIWTQRMGQGYAVFWRLPVSDWQRDPRALLMLNNAMLFLMNPPRAIERDAPQNISTKETP